MIMKRFLWKLRLELAILLILVVTIGVTEHFRKPTTCRDLAANILTANQDVQIQLQGFKLLVDDTGVSASSDEMFDQAHKLFRAGVKRLRLERVLEIQTTKCPELTTKTPEIINMFPWNDLPWILKNKAVARAFIGEVERMLANDEARLHDLL